MCVLRIISRTYSLYTTYTVAVKTDSAHSALSDIAKSHTDQYICLNGIHIGLVFTIVLVVRCLGSTYVRRLDGSQSAGMRKAILTSPGSHNWEGQRNIDYSEN